MTVEILQVERAHLPRIAALEACCFAEPWSETALELFLGDGAVAFAALENGELLGYIGMLFAPDEGQILNLAVFPEARGRGIAKRLLAHLLQDAAARGFDSVSLEVRLSNTPAVRLYESFGFSKAGVRRHFYRHPAEDALVLIKNLSENVQKRG